MALMRCPECNKEISDKAVSCPNCGFPLNRLSIEDNLTTEEELTCPDFPSDLSVGRLLTDWAGDTVLDGDFDANENVIEGILSGTVSVMNTQRGIQISGRMYAPLVQIHRSQIISLKKSNTHELIQANKSVIGRAVVGGLILGPLGAIVGGMSGLGSKAVNKSYLIINYWSVNTRKPMSILISTNKNMDKFIRRYEREATHVEPITNQLPDLKELFQGGVKKEEDVQVEKSPEPTPSIIVKDTSVIDGGIKAPPRRISTAKGIVILSLLIGVGFPLAVILSQIGHEHSGGGRSNKADRYSWAQYLTKTECDEWGSKGATYGEMDRLSGNYDSSGKKRMATSDISLSDNRLSEIWTCFETGYDTAYYKRY